MSSRLSRRRVVSKHDAKTEAPRAKGEVSRDLKSVVKYFMFLHVRQADYIGQYRIRLRFNDGAEGVVDLSDALEGEVFEPLKDIAQFKAFRVDPDIETIVWPNGADMAPEYLYNKMTVMH